MGVLDDIHEYCKLAWSEEHRDVTEIALNFSEQASLWVECVIGEGVYVVDICGAHISHITNPVTGSQITILDKVPYYS